VGVAELAGEVNAARADLAEEEHRSAPQQDGLHAEEVAGDAASRLLAQELAPTRAVSSWCRPEPVVEQDATDRTASDADRQLPQLAGDALVAPARVRP
jgi:hypothetical protein